MFYENPRESWEMDTASHRNICTILLHDAARVLYRYNSNIDKQPRQRRILQLASIFPNDNQLIQSFKACTVDQHSRWREFWGLPIGHESLKPGDRIVLITFVTHSITIARTSQSETKKREKKKRKEGVGYKVGCNFESIWILDIVGKQ